MICVLAEEDIKDTDTQREDRMKTQREDGHLQAEDRGRGRNQPCQHLGLQILVPRTVR